MPAGAFSCYDRIDLLAEDFEETIARNKTPSSPKQSLSSSGEKQRRKVAQKQLYRASLAEFKGIKSEVVPECDHVLWQARLERAFQQSFGEVVKCDVIPPSKVNHNKSIMDGDNEEIFQFWVKRRATSATVSFVAGEYVRVEVVRQTANNLFLSVTDVQREVVEDLSSIRYDKCVTNGHEFRDVTLHYWLTWTTEAQVSALKLPGLSAGLSVVRIRRDWISRTIEQLALLAVADERFIDPTTCRLQRNYRLFQTKHNAVFLGKKENAQLAVRGTKEVVDASDPRPRSPYAAYVLVKRGSAGILYKNVGLKSGNLSADTSLNWASSKYISSR